MTKFYRQLAGTAADVTTDHAPGNPPAHRARACPDLAAQQARCDLNYLYLQRLLHNFRDARQRVLYAPGAQPGQEARLRIRFLERHRYTEILCIELYVGDGYTGADREIVLTVRVYKDLRCAEVSLCNGHRLRARYPYPNARMFSPDEKFQLNRFLGEWLGHCVQHGYSGALTSREA